MATNGVIEATHPQFQTRSITLLLKHNLRYSIYVRADNCNNTQRGMNSSALTINGQCITWQNKKTNRKIKLDFDLVTMRVVSKAM